MGICCGTSFLPPQPQLIGTWILNQQSRQFNVHLSPQRQSYDMNSKINNSLICKKLIVKGNGNIKYQECNQGLLFEIQGPVVKWESRSVETFNGSVIKIDYRKAKDGYILVQDDRLYRA